MVRKPGNTLVQIFRRIHADLPFHINNLSIGLSHFSFLLHVTSKIPARVAQW